MWISSRCLTAGNAPGPQLRSQSLRASVCPKIFVNVEGGVIAHGHPIAATGGGTHDPYLHSMKRDRAQEGVVTLCIRRGQGIALALNPLADCVMTDGLSTARNEC